MSIAGVRSDLTMRVVVQSGVYSRDLLVDPFALCKFRSSLRGPRVRYCESWTAIFARGTARVGLPLMTEAVISQRTCAQG